MKFLLRYKIYELTEQYGHKVSHTAPYHCHPSPTGVVWCQTKRYYDSSIGQYRFGMEAVENMWEELLEQVCMFVLSVLTIKERL
jgi:hypothetical protein